MADSKWVAYLIDFMETTTNLAGQNMEIKKTDLFFIENNDLIEKLISERDAFLQRLNQKVSILCTMMSESSVADAFSQAPWVYSGNCVVLDFQFPISSETYSIAFDVYLNPTGWGLHLFGRNKKSKSFLLKLISQPSLRSSRAASATITNDRHIVQTWPLQTDLVELKDALCEYVGALVAAYDASKISAEAFSV